MSMLDSFFNKGFRGSKCKTMLKLTIPRIKLLRNRRELQIKQMRKEIAKLLETGQEATARIRVEHIVREENMMAAQEVIELFSELVSVRLPIIETQRECPIDLKEAISSLCFAAPRCADLPELMQVQMAFASKYGKEFVAAATELMPDCGVNRQLIELLSVRAPSAEKKLNLLKEIAEEHGLDWDPSASETELFKSHADLLDGSTQYLSGNKVPLPKEKHDEILQSVSSKPADEQYDSDPELDFPEVPTEIMRKNSSTKEEAPLPSAPHPELYQPKTTEYENLAHHTSKKLEDDEYVVAKDQEIPKPPEVRQFVPFISPPFPSQSESIRETFESDPLPKSPPKVKSENLDSQVNQETKFDLQDVLLAAQAAAESAERAAASARSAASLAQLRFSELSNKKSGPTPDVLPDNPFGMESSILSPTEERQIPSPDSDSGGAKEAHSKYVSQENEQFDEDSSGFRTYGYDNNESLFKSSSSFDETPKQVDTQNQNQPDRLTSEEDLLSSYPNLFGSGGHSFTENKRSNT